MVARAYEPGKAPSAVVSQTYIALASDVLSFNSNLPIVIVDTSRRSVGTTLTQVSAVFIDTGLQGRAKITDPPDFAGRGGIKKRGRSTGRKPSPNMGSKCGTRTIGIGTIPFLACPPTPIGSCTLPTPSTGP